MVGVKRSASSAPGADQIIPYADILAALPNQDVIVLACALTDDTRDMVNKAFLDAMKPDSILVNIGRGDLIVEEELLTTLNNDAIDYAVLDVFSY